MSYDLFGGADYELDFDSEEEPDFSFGSMEGGARRRRGSSRRRSRSPRRRSRGRGARKSAYVSGKASRLGLLKKPRLKFDPKTGQYVAKKRRGRSGRNVFISHFAKTNKVAGPRLMTLANAAWKRLSAAEKNKWEAKGRAMGLKPAAHTRAVPKRVRSKLRRSVRRKSPRRKSPAKGRGSRRRGSPKRKSPKRKSPKRKSTKRRSPKRKSTKRRSPKRKSTKRKSPKRKSTKRKSPKRRARRSKQTGHGLFDFFGGSTNAGADYEDSDDSSMDFTF